MKDLKKQLLKLGSSNPDLQEDLRPVLDYLSRNSYSNGDYGDQSKNKSFYPDEESLKEASNKMPLFDIIPKKEYYAAQKTLRDAGDPQSAKLLKDVLLHINKVMQLPSAEEQALNKMSNLLGKKSSPENMRNQIFKAADLLKIKLPSGSF